MYRYKHDSLEMLKCFSLEIISLLFEGYLQRVSIKCCILLKTNSLFYVSLK